MSAWKLESAKARLSEVVRQARQEGPQTITVRGANAAVILSSEDYARLLGNPRSPSWVDRFREGFTGDIEFERDPDGGGDLAA
jgi:prevent-host-death family protein